MKKAASLAKPSAAGPICVVLFDEIEKAHHDVFNVLLQVLDDGKTHGRTGKDRSISKNSIVIMTSNIGSPIIHEYFSGGKLGHQRPCRNGAIGPQRTALPFPARIPESRR